MIGYLIAATLIGIGIGIGLLLGAVLDFNVRRPADEHETLFNHDLKRNP